MLRSSFLPSAAALLLAACASNPDQHVRALGSVGKFADLELTYEASVSTLAWNVTDLDIDEESAPQEAEQFVRIETRTVVLTDAEVTALLGSERGGAWSIKTNRNRARAWFDRAAESTKQEQQALTLYPDRQSYMTVANQTAFIESFDIKGTARELIADPVISVACEGIAFIAVGSPSENGDSVRVEATLERHDLADPIATLEVHLPKIFAPFTIQRPVTTHQRAEVTADLARDEAVVMAIPRAGDQTHMDVVLLTATAIAGNKAKADPQD